MVRASVCGIESAGSIPAIRPRVVVWSRGKTGACKALNGGSNPPTAFSTFQKVLFRRSKKVFGSFAGKERVLSLDGKDRKITAFLESFHEPLPPYRFP